MSVDVYMSLVELTLSSERSLTLMETINEFLESIRNDSSLSLALGARCGDAKDIEHLMIFTNLRSPVL